MRQEEQNQSDKPMNDIIQKQNRPISIEQLKAQRKLCSGRRHGCISINAC
jgi:hypothetical protein